jgi:Xaa-Pro aminopeptidase
LFNWQVSLTKNFFVNNRARLKELHPNSLIVIAGNTPMQRSGDACYPFRQDSNFWYLTGIDEPNLLLVMDTKYNREFIVYKKKPKEVLIFEGDYDFKNYEATSGVKHFATASETIKLFSGDNDFEKIYLNLAKKRWGIGVNPFRRFAQKELKKYTNKISDIRPSMDSLRMIKQPCEIELIKKASDITKQVLNFVQSEIIPTAKSECDIARAIDIEFIKQGVAHAYEPIIAAGKNGLTLHYAKNNGPISASSKTVLLDVGAEYNHYASDISRTVVINTDPQAIKLIGAVTEAQAAIIERIKPGISWKQLQIMAQEILVQKLKALKEPVNMDNIATFFPHAIGHFLGLGVHDMGDYRQPLEENMVITVEPGYYNPANGFGVRIEDIVQITKNGAVKL